MMPWMVSGTWMSEGFWERTKRDLLLDGAVLQEGMGQLLDEEGIAGGSVHDELANFGGHLPSFEDRLYQLGAWERGSWSTPILAVVGLAAPGVGVFRAVEQEEEDLGLGQPVDEIG